MTTHTNNKLNQLYNACCAHADKVLWIDKHVHQAKHMVSQWIVVLTNGH